MKRRKWAACGPDRARWAALRLVIFERDGYRCRQCGKAGRLECDHVTPLNAGGSAWDPANLQSLCRSCHVGKHRKPVPREVAEWRARLAEV